MARVACTVMLKDEVTLTSPFLRYHAALFGVENIYVVDNGTTEPGVLATLEAFERAGGHVDRSFPTEADYREKGEIISGLVKSLDAEADYDLYILLDCDEFVAVRSGEGFSCAPLAIHACLDAMVGGDSIWRVGTNLANIPGRPGLFQVADYAKTIFPHGVLGATDHGHHAGWTHDARTDFVPCGIVYVHFHYRPYDEVYRFARQKLAAEMPREDLDDLERLRQFKGRGWHLVEYVLGSPESYYRQFRDIPAPFHFQELTSRFNEIGTAAPFSDFVLPPDAYGAGVAAPAREPPFVVMDEASLWRVRGWAADPAALSEPVPARFFIGGAAVWDGLCDRPRPDVKKGGHPIDRAGFDFDAVVADGLPERTLTVRHRDGTPMQIFMHGKTVSSLALSPPEIAAAPSVVVDEATTARVRGWALDPSKPDDPIYLRFLVNGTSVWGGRCDGFRPDVKKASHSTGCAGFDFLLPIGLPLADRLLLTVRDGDGVPLRLSTGAESRPEVALTTAAEHPNTGSAIHSHIDSFRNGMVHGWVMRTVSTPEGPRLLGRCTVALVHQGRVITQGVGDIPRADVADALRGEPQCGFAIEVPRALLASERNPVFGLFVMPERRELAGSPCLLAPSS